MKGAMSFLSALLLLYSTYAGAVVDMGAPLNKVVKVYSAPDPIGLLSIAYNAPSSSGAASLAINCDLFSVSIPNEGIDDLPRPDWEAVSVNYSFESDSSGNLTDIPYLSIRVNLNGPIRQPTWERTWAIFHLDSTGKVTRYIRRHLPKDKFNMTRAISEEWKIGQGVNVADILEAAQNEF